MSKGTALAVGAVVALTGCASTPSHQAAAPAGPQVGVSAPGSATPDAQPSHGPGAQPSAHSGGSAQQSSGPFTQPGASSQPSTRPSPTHITLDADLSAECVVPGGELTVTVRARPAMSVIADTHYADDKDGQAHGGIDVHGQTDATGHYAFTWTVGKTTPVGAADIQVAAVDREGTGNRRLPFNVAAICP